MKLTDKNGFSITFEVSGYECYWSDLGFDSNWLNITTFVTHPLGTSKNIAPSLLSDELESLRDFFKTITDKPTESIDLFFLKPNLGFQYLSVESKKNLTVFFDIEFETETYWFEKSDSVDITNLSLEIPFDSNEFKNALESIAKYCVKYPRRPLTWQGTSSLIHVILP